MHKKIEDVISSALTSNAQKNALSFITYVQESEGISVSGDDNDEGRWWIGYENNLLCEIQIKAVSDDSPGGWDVWFYGDCIGKQDSPVDDTVKETAWANITLCGNCGADCAPGRSKTIFGKVFENVCQSTLGFTNPEAGILDCMRKIIDCR